MASAAVEVLKPSNPRGTEPWAAYSRMSCQNKRVGCGPPPQQPFCEPQAMPAVWNEQDQARELGATSRSPGQGRAARAHLPGRAIRAEESWGGTGTGRDQARPMAMGQQAQVSAGCVPTGQGDSPGHGHLMVSRSTSQGHSREGAALSSTSSLQPKFLPPMR